MSVTSTSNSSALQRASVSTPSAHSVTSQPSSSLAHQQIPVDRIVLGHQHPQPQPPQTSVRPVFGPAMAIVPVRFGCRQLGRRPLALRQRDRFNDAVPQMAGDMYFGQAPLRLVRSVWNARYPRPIPFDRRQPLGQQFHQDAVPLGGHAAAVDGPRAGAGQRQPRAVSCATSATGARTHTAGVGAISPPPARRAASAVTRSGSWKMNVLPRPGLLSSVMLPCISSQRLWQI